MTATLTQTRVGAKFRETLSAVNCRAYVATNPHHDRHVSAKAVTCVTRNTPVENADCLLNAQCHFFALVQVRGNVHVRITTESAYAFQ